MEQKIWFITGVSKGLGREMARTAVQCGAIVYGTVRNEKDKADFESELNMKAFIIDLSDTTQIEYIISNLIGLHGQIDVLVNNAGYGAFGMIETFTEEEIRKQFDVNFFSVWKLCKAVLPGMRERRQGTIVQISSRLGIVAGVGNGIYAASKFAMEGFSEALEQEVKAFGIKVLLVEPGAMKTDFFGESVAYAQNKIDDYNTLLGDVREKTKGIHGNQSGNPVKAAEIIVKTVLENTNIFRLPLTKGTISAYTSKAQELQHGIDTLSSIANSADF